MASPRRSHRQDHVDPEDHIGDVDAFQTLSVRRPTTRGTVRRARSPGELAVLLVSRPVGGILSTGPSRGSGWVTIHLSGLPEECPSGPTGRRCPLLGLAPGGGCHPPGSLPTMVRSYRTVSPLPVPTLGTAIGGLLSVARSVRSLRPGSRQHPALWSPDLPRRRTEARRRGHPDDSPAVQVCLKRRHPAFCVRLTSWGDVGYTQNRSSAASSVKGREPIGDGRPRSPRHRSELPPGQERSISPVLLPLSSHPSGSGADVDAGGGVRRGRARSSCSPGRSRARTGVG